MPRAFATTTRPHPQRRPRRGTSGRGVATMVLLAGAVVMVAPFMATLANSLKTFQQLLVVPTQWLPDPVVWSNYAEVWARTPFLMWAFNSVMVTTLAVVGSVLTSAMVGHALARMRLPGKDALLVAALGTLMLPTVITIVPTFVIFRELGWLNTHVPLIAPFWLATPFGIFIMRQAFLAVPRDYEEAATIDGANPWRVFWRVHMPLVKPALATVAVFTFMTSWNAVLEPVIYLTSQERFTLPIGVLSMQGQFIGNDQLVMAAALMSLLPMLTVFLIAQRFFVNGAILSGVKG